MRQRPSQISEPLSQSEPQLQQLARAVFLQNNDALQVLSLPRIFFFFRFVRVRLKHFILQNELGTSD
jgi:hypothetical protein